MPLKIKIRAALFCLMTLSAAACQNQPPPNNIPLIPLQENSPCTSLPCWDGIIPGTVSVAQAQAALESKYGVGNVTVESRRITWSDASTDPSWGGFAYIDQQSVVGGLLVGFFEEEWTVAQVIEHLGEPNRVYVTRSGVDDVSCGDAILAYPNFGTSVLLYDDPQTSVGVSADQAVEYFSFSSLDDANRLEPADSDAFDWQGYTDYCALVTP